MTHLPQYFKMSSLIVALSLPLSCISNTVSPQDERIGQHLKSLQTQNQKLEEKALAIESQIDEIRRATPNTRAREIETLHLQFKELKDTHTAIQQEMSTLRKDLKIEK